MMITKLKNHGLCLKGTPSRTLQYHWALLSHPVFQHLIQSPMPSQTFKAVMLPLHPLPPLPLLPFRMPGPARTQTYKRPPSVASSGDGLRGARQAQADSLFSTWCSPNVPEATTSAYHRLRNLSNGIMWTSSKSMKTFFRTARDLI